MSEDLASLRQAILDQVRQDTQKRLDDARAEAESTRQQAEREANVAAARLVQAARDEADTLCQQAAAKTRLEAQMFKLQRREHVLEQVFEQARAQMAQVPARDNYSDLACDLVRQAARHIESAPVLILRADAETERVFTPAVLHALSAELGMALERGPTWAIGIGVVLETPDHHRRYDNTLQTRMERMLPTLRAPIYHILTGQHHE